MSFFTKLMSDVTPKADAITNTTKNAAHKVSENRAVQAAKNLSYKGLVNTTAVAVVVIRPAAPAIEAAWSWLKKSSVAPATKK